jgi:hypothetical protein
MRPRLFTREVLPFYAAIIGLVAATLVVDGLLHWLSIDWVGRYVGIPGVMLILGSFGFSLRKRKLISVGAPADLLRAHEAMAWVGCLLVLVHAGIHFNAILGWLAVGAMMINVASGLTGRHLLKRAWRRLDEANAGLRASGLSEAEVADRLYWDSLTFDVVKQWRTAHFPIALAFAVLALAHIGSVFLFWGWK